MPNIDCKSYIVKCLSLKIVGNSPKFNSSERCKKKNCKFSI